MNGDQFESILTRASVIAGGSYHAGTAANVHWVARLAAAVLLLVLVCRLIAKRRGHATEIPTE